MTTEFNRDQRRQLKKMGALTAQGTPARTAPTPRAQREPRTSPAQYLREVRAELKKVAWPTRPEVRKYSIVVLVTVVLVTAFVTLLDFLFGTGALWLYEQ
jgi:preprotein translocase subunit SecE